MTCLDDFKYANRLGCSIRQVSRIQRVDDGFFGFVGPVLVQQGSSFGRNEGANNVVTIHGRYGGESSFSGAGAGGPATAVAVVSDLLTLSRNGQGERHSTEQWMPASFVPPPPLPYFLRFVVRDQAGILATIAAALARREINVDALAQEPGYPKDALPFVITVEPCEEAALLEALKDLAAEDWHAQPPLAMPMLLGS
jgi:homoserine dehydrogenase